MIQNDNNIVENETLPIAEPDGSNTDDHCDLWDLHKSLEKKRNDERGYNNTAREELRSYLHHDILKLDLDPLIEWEKTKTIFSKLYKLAMKYLVVPGTSVPSERLFGKAGETISKTRNRLTGSRVSKLLFLQSVDKNQWNF